MAKFFFIFFAARRGLLTAGRALRIAMMREDGEDEDADDGNDGCLSVPLSRAQGPSDRLQSLLGKTSNSASLARRETRVFARHQALGQHSEDASPANRCRHAAWCLFLSLPLFLRVLVFIFVVHFFFFHLLRLMATRKSVPRRNEAARSRRSAPKRAKRVFLFG